VFPKSPRPEPPRKAIAMQVVQQRVSGAVDTTIIVVPASAPASPAPAAVDDLPPGQGRGIQPI
jgi:hypothetical protein